MSCIVKTTYSCIMRYSLIASPLFVIAIPIVWHYYLGANLPWLLAMFVLIDLNMLEIVLYRSWIANALEQDMRSNQTNMAA